MFCRQTLSSWKMFRTLFATLFTTLCREHLRPRKQIGPGAPRAPKNYTHCVVTAWPSLCATLCASTFVQGNTIGPGPPDAPPKKYAVFAFPYSPPCAQAPVSNETDRPRRHPQKRHPLCAHTYSQPCARAPSSKETHRPWSSEGIPKRHPFCAPFP